MLFYKMFSSIQYRRFKEGLWDECELLDIETIEVKQKKDKHGIKGKTHFHSILFIYFALSVNMTQSVHSL